MRAKNTLETRENSSLSLCARSTHDNKNRQNNTNIIKSNSHALARSLSAETDNSWCILLIYT